MAYKASCIRGLAITQMILGALMVVIAVACIFAVHHWSSYVGFGIWIGIWVIITGVLGYIGARNDAVPNKCLIGCFMGFAITACVLAGIMLICYSISLSEFADRLRCTYNYYWNGDYSYSTYDRCNVRYGTGRASARNGAGLGSCLLIFSVIEFFVALISSIVCCGAICCTSSVPTQTPAQQVMFAPAQQMYQGPQPGVVIMQPSGQVTTMQAAYATQAQQPFFFPQQFQPAQQQPGYIMPSGSVPGVSYATGVTMPTYTNAQQGHKAVEMPPPYSHGSVGMTPVASEGYPGFQVASSN